MGALSQAAHHRHPVRAPEDAGAVRRAVGRLAAACEGVRVAEAELVATELATNIVLHTASGGYVLSRAADGGIELLAVDRGPGRRGLDGWRRAASRDHAGAVPAPSRPEGLGAGLAAVERLASTFDLYSTEAGGTVVLARLGTRSSGRRSGGGGSTGPFRWGAVNVPLTGDGVSGDGWAVVADGLLVALVVDGLGHGPAAHDASEAAVAALGEQPPADLCDFVRRAHEAMRGTRGGVLGVCAVDPRHDQLTYVGVGNVSGRVLLREARRGLLGREGTLGTQVPAPRLHVERLPWPPGATLVLASDGIRSQWDPRSYPGLLDRDPAVVAATLHRDHARGTDDATVLVVRDLRSPAA